MKRQQLRVGMRLRLSGQEYLIEQRLPDGQVLFKHIASGNLSARPEHEIAKAMSRDDGEVAYEMDEARYGGRVADLRKRANRPQIDHTKLDLVLIDEKTSLPISHPWLEIHVCAFTRRILAFKAVHGSPANQN